MDDLVHGLTTSVPRLIAALAVLVVGFIIAAVVAALVRGGLRRSGLDRRLAQRLGAREGESPIDVAALAGRIVYYLILVLVVIAVCNALGITLVTAPLALLISGVLGFIPNLLGAAILLLIAWVIASILRAVVYQALRAVRLDERVGQGGGPSLSRSLSEVVYWLVFLLFLPTILTALKLEGLLVPVQVLLNTVLGFLPRLVSAAIILVVGLFVARLVQRIVTNLLAAAGVDRLGARVGFTPATGGQQVSQVIGLIVYVLIAIPVLTATLDALQLGAVTQPISNMLNRILAALPNIFAAAVLVVLAYVIGRVVANLVTAVLTGVGFNRLPERLGFAPAALDGGVTPAGVVGTLVLVAMVLFASIAALGLLGFGVVAELVNRFMFQAGHIILGLIIFAIGLWLARLAAYAIEHSGVGQPRLLAFVARAAILVLAGAMALTQMGVATSIINLAFGLLLGALAIAAAIAFGVGGREVAGRELERWVTAARGGAVIAPQLPRGDGPEGNDMLPSDD